MTVNGVANAEHATARVFQRVHIVHGPNRSGLDLDRNVVVADQIMRDLRRHGVGHRRRRLVDIITPDDEPFAPGPHHADQSHADAADVRTRLHHPVEHAGAMRDIFGEIGLEHNVHRARDAHLAFHRQTDVLRHLGPSAIGADDIFGSDLVSLTGNVILDVDGDAVRVLFQAEILPVEHDRGAAPRRRIDQDRLQQVLRHVADRRRARQGVIGLALWMRAPGQQAPEFLARQRGAEDIVAHILLGGALFLHRLFDAEVSENLHRALVGDVRARRPAQPVPFGDDQRLDSV